MDEPVEELSTNIELLAKQICISDNDALLVERHFNEHFRDQLPFEVLTLYASMTDIKKALLYLKDQYGYSVHLDYIAHAFKRKDYSISPDTGIFLLAYIFLNRSYTPGDRTTLIRILLKSKVNISIWNFIIDKMDEYFAGEKLEEVSDILRSEYSRNKLVNGMNGS
mgnify:FL=1